MGFLFYSSFVIAGDRIPTNSANWELIDLPASGYSHNSIGSPEWILIKCRSE